MVSDPDLTSPRSADRVYDQVKAMAVAYRLRPSERINEVELARQLGVSRTPLREALNRLAAEGFLVATVNRGYTMMPLDSQRVLTLYEYRTMLEIGALRLTCERASDAELSELHAFARHSRDEIDDDAHALRLLSLDEQFHEGLAHLSGNDELMRALRLLNERIRFIRWIDMQGRRSGTQAEHLQITEHLRRREAEAAAAQMQAHITRRLDQIRDMIRTGFAEIYTGNAMAAQALGDVA